VFYVFCVVDTAEEGAGMLKFLSNHPFSVRAYFEESLVLTYAAPADLLRSFVPESLELDLFDEKWAFMAVAMVKAKALRPAFFPEIVGSDFILCGYRVFVRYRGADGRSRRGLLILKSGTDRGRMVLLGNLFTKYHYEKMAISWIIEKSNLHTVESANGMRVHAELGDHQIDLPKGSPFADWREARRFAGPMPFTFSYNAEQSQMTIVEGVRETWKPSPVHVHQHEVPYLAELGLKGAILANAFHVRDVPYFWKKGRIERC